MATRAARPTGGRASGGRAGRPAVDLVDLSHAVESGVPGYPGLPAPRVEPHISHAASRAAYGGRAEFEITRVFLVGNTGTYLDSPYHRHRGAPDVAGLPLAAVAALPGVRLDAALGEDGRTIGLDLDAAGADDGALAGRAVLVRTGWDARRGSPGYWAPGPFVPAGLAVVPAHIVDKVRALVLGLGLSKLRTEGGLSCSIVRPSSRRLAGSS